MGDRDSKSSFSDCDWESIDADAIRGGIPAEGGTANQQRIVLELPPDGLPSNVVASAAAVAKAKNPCGDDYEDRSSLSSFVPVSRPDNISTQTKEATSAGSSYQYISESDDSSLLSNFDILSLSSGEVRRCKRCKFHNKSYSVICDSCGLALVANPNIDMDAQIALNLKRKEEQEATSIFMEAERKRNRIHQDPLYDHACILTRAIKEKCSTMLENIGLKTLLEEDLEGLALEFIKQARDRPEVKKISFTYKCTSHSSLECIRTSGFQADQPFGMAAYEVEVSHSLADALASFETLEMMQGESLRPIPENADGVDVDDAGAGSGPSCLCWIVAILQPRDSLGDLNSRCSPTETLPLAYFDSSCKDDLLILLSSFLCGLDESFVEFFVHSYQLPISFSSFTSRPPTKKTKQSDADKECTKTGMYDDLEDSSVDVSSESNEDSSPSAELTGMGKEDVIHFRDNETEPLKSDSEATVSNLSRMFFDASSFNRNLTSQNTAKSLQMELYEEDTNVRDHGKADVRDDGIGLLKTDSETLSLQMKLPLTALEAFGDGVVFFCNDGNGRFWNRNSGVYKTLKTANFAVCCLDLNHSVQDHQLLATGDLNGAVSIYILPSDSSEEITNDATWVFNSERPRPIMDVRFLPKGTAIATANSNRDCQLWSLVNESCICSLKSTFPDPCKKHLLWLAVARFGPEGTSLASVSEGSKFIHFWKFRGNRHELSGHDRSPDVVGRQEYRIRALDFSPDGKYLASGGNDCTIRLWELRKDDIPCTKIIRAQEALSSLAFSPDSTLVAGGCVNGAIEVWNVSPGSDEPLNSFASTSGSIKSLVFFNDGKSLASTGWTDGTLRVWNLTH